MYNMSLQFIALLLCTVYNMSLHFIALLLCTTSLLYYCVQCSLHFIALLLCTMSRYTSLLYYCVQCLVTLHCFITVYNVSLHFIALLLCTLSRYTSLHPFLSGVFRGVCICSRLFMLLLFILFCLEKKKNTSQTRMTASVLKQDPNT